MKLEHLSDSKIRILLKPNNNSFDEPWIMNLWNIYLSNTSYSKHDSFSNFLRDEYNLQMTSETKFSSNNRWSIDWSIIFQSIEHYMEIIVKFS